MIDLHEYFAEQKMIRSRDKSPVRVMGFKRAPELYSLFNLLGFTEGAEIGVRWGSNAIEMFKAIPPLHLIAVDPWQDYLDIDKKLTDAKHERLFDKARKTLAPYNVTYARMKSMEAVATIPPESLDFVYIDGNHSFDYVMEDLIEWTRRVKPGGIVSGHDLCGYRQQQVIEAVETYTTAHCLDIDEVFVTDEQAPSYFWRKK